MRDLDAIARAYEERVASVPAEARRLAEERWGKTWAHAEMGSLLDFAAALSAARAGDGRGASEDAEIDGVRVTEAICADKVIRDLRARLVEMERERDDALGAYNVVRHALVTRHAAGHDLRLEAEAERDDLKARLAAAVGALGDAIQAMYDPHRRSAWTRGFNALPHLGVHPRNDHDAGLRARAVFVKRTAAHADR